MKINFKKLINYSIILFLIIFCLGILSLNMRGNKGIHGMPFFYQIEKNTSVGGPFESTNSNSRYALVEAMVDHHTFFFTNEEAKFSASDIVFYKGKYFSIFTPGISFLGIPFYVIGKSLGYPQLATYSLILIVAVINMFLVAKLSRKLGVNFLTSLLCGFIFLFASNALAYSLTFTQHHVSTMLILLALLNVLEERTVLNDIFLSLIYGLSILVDIPNPIILLPVLIYAFMKHINKTEISTKVTLRIKTSLIFLLLFIIPFLAVFAWYNHFLTGTYTKIGQTLGRSDYPAPKVAKIAKKEIHTIFTDAPLPFESRGQFFGLYILLASDERGWLYYSPIMALGILGLLYAYRKKINQPLVINSIGIIGTTIVVYSMHGDPWGGWSFGSRYLIPSSAIVAAYMGLLIERYKKNVFFIILFFSLLIWSVYINAAGALTTNAIPPKIEAIHLQKPIPYTYKYNLNLLKQNKAASLVYNLYFWDKMTLYTYFMYIVASIVGISGLLYLLSGFNRHPGKRDTRAHPGSLAEATKEILDKPE